MRPFLLACVQPPSPPLRKNPTFPDRRGWLYTTKTEEGLSTSHFPLPTSDFRRPFWALVVHGQCLLKRPFFVSSQDAEPLWSASRLLKGQRYLKVRAGVSARVGGGGGGTYFGFQVTGMIEWGKNQHPTKSLGFQTKPKKLHGPKFSPQKSHAEFSSHKNFQKALNDITREIEKKITDQNFLT